MEQEEPRAVQSRGAGLQDKVRIAQSIGARRKHTRRSGPAEQAENEKRNQNRDQRSDVQREEGANRDQQEKPGQRKKQVSEAPRQSQPDSAQVSCQPADQRGQDGGNQRRRWREQKRDARAVKNAREAIAAN